MVRASSVWKQLPEEVKLPTGPQANGVFLLSHQLYLLVLPIDTASLSTNVWKSACGLFYILFFCIVVSRLWLHNICISNCSYQSTRGLPFWRATSPYQVSTNPLMKYNTSELYPISREAEYFYSQPSCKLPPRMQRVSGHLWRVVAYDIWTVGGYLEAKVQTHLCFEENVLHAIVSSQYIVNPCCFWKLP